MQRERGREAEKEAGIQSGQRMIKVKTRIEVRMYVSRLWVRMEKCRNNNKKLSDN